VVTNRLLDRLPEKDRTRVLERCEKVELAFPDIVDTVARVVEAHAGHEGDATSLDGVLGADAWARAEAELLVGSGA